tara:strand:+ start:94 stop:342 length:249 start_codon:yes stop_codon:yes gene_type:complete
MWIMITIALMGGLNGKSYHDIDNIWTPDVFSFDTEELCHENIRRLHNSSFKKGWSLVWKAGALTLTNPDKDMMHICLRVTPT